MSRYVDMDKCPCNNGGACEADCVFDKPCKRYEEWYSGEAVQPVIHCADCGFYEDLDGVMVCKIWDVFGEHASPPETGFCHCAVKREERVKALNKQVQATLRMEQGESERDITRKVSFGSTTGGEHE